MKKISLALLAFAAALSILFVPLQVVYADPADVFTQACTTTNNDKTICSGSNGSGVFGIIKQVINVMLIVGGVIAVIMIIIGGIRYMTSNGEQSNVKAAKDTILYAVIGLVVSVLAFSIVNFVIGKL